MPESQLKAHKSISTPTKLLKQQTIEEQVNGFHINIWTQIAVSLATMDTPLGAESWQICNLTDCTAAGFVTLSKIHWSKIKTTLEKHCHEFHLTLVVLLPPRENPLKIHIFLRDSLCYYPPVYRCVEHCRPLVFLKNFIYFPKICSNRKT